MINPILTDVGLQALVDAKNNGISIKIAKVGFGDGIYNADKSQTSLMSEKVRVDIASAKISQNHIDFSIVLPEDTPNFPIREIGWFNEDGKLIYVWSTGSEEFLAWKTSFTRFVSGIRVQVSDTENIQVIEAQPDLTLMYLEEFIGITTAYTKLAKAIAVLNEKIFEIEKRIGG